MLKFHTAKHSPSYVSKLRKTSEAVDKLVTAEHRKARGLMGLLLSTDLGRNSDKREAA